MLGCNQDITVWIRKKIPETGQEIFTRQVLPVKCRWKNKIIIIPYFDGLPDMQIKKGDLAALGVCNIEITGITPYTASEVRRLLSPNIAMIDSVSCNYFDEKGKHLRLTGN